MPREKTFINDFSGGLNSGSDPKDLDVNQHSASNNMDYNTSGQVKVLGNPTSQTDYDPIDTTLLEGKGLFSYNSPYAVTTQTASGNEGFMVNITETTTSDPGSKSKLTWIPEYHSFHELNQIGVPVGLSGFAYDATNLRTQVTTCDTLLNTGVRINSGIGYGAGHATAMQVDTVDATTVFEVGDMIFTAGGEEIGVIDKITSGTSITVHGQNYDTLEYAENGYAAGIKVTLSNDDLLYRSRSVSCDIDATGATLLVPGQRVYHANLHNHCFLTKVRHARLEVNGSFDGTLAIGSANDQWTDETVNGSSNCTATKDTGSNGWDGANSMKAVVEASSQGHIYYRRTDFVVGKEYNASIRVNVGDSQSIVDVKIGAHSSAVFGVGAASNWAFEGQEGAPSAFADRTKSRTFQISFKPTNADYYVGIQITGTNSHFCFIDDFRITSRWFVDRFEISHPAEAALTNATFKFDKVLFHDLCVYDGLSFGSEKNWLGISQIVTSGGGDIGTRISNTLPVAEDWTSLAAAVVSLINGTDETLPADASANLTLYSKDNSYGQNPEWTDTDNMTYLGKAGDLGSTYEAIDMGDGLFAIKAKAIGTASNTRMRLASYWNPINYDGHIQEKNLSSVPASTRKVIDYRMYHKKTNLNLYDNNYTWDGVLWPWNKNICTEKNGFPGFKGFKWGSDGNINSNNQGKQWTLDTSWGGTNAVAQVSTITGSGTPSGGDVFTVTLNGDDSGKKASVTGDGSPTIDELMDNSTGITNAMNAISAITDILTLSYNSGTDTLTCTADAAGTPFALTYSIESTITEYKDDKHLILIDKAGKFQWNSTEANYGWLNNFSSTAMWSSNPTTTIPVFFADSGKARMCDANFNNANANKEFSYVKQEDLWTGSGGSNLDIGTWMLSNQKVSWTHTEAGGKGLRERMDTAVDCSDATMDIKVEVITGTISDLDVTDTTCTANCSAAHGLSVGDQVDISGGNIPTDLLGRYDIASVVDADTFTFLHNLDADPGDDYNGTFHQVGDWDETFKFFASAYDIDGNETLPDHVFTHDGSNTQTLELAGRVLKFSIEADPGAITGNEDAYIANYKTKGFRIYFGKSQDGYGEKWKLFDLDFKDGLIRADSGVVTPWSQHSSEIVEIAGGVSIYSPIEIGTFETQNGYSSNNSLLDAKYKTATINGRRLFVGNVSYGGFQYNDRMIVSPYNMLDVLPTPYGIIEVTTSDGQSIKVLKSYGDRVLQFKSQSLYVINVGSGEPSTFYLEAAHRYYGCEDNNHAVETPIGVIWANKSSVYLFNGEADKIIDLFKYAPEEDLKELGTAGVNRTTRRISTSDWSDFYSSNLIVGFEPISRLVIFKRSCVASGSNIGDCYIYNIDNDSWTFAKDKWAPGCAQTNFVTDLDDSLINIVEATQLADFSEGGDIGKGEAGS